MEIHQKEQQINNALRSIDQRNVVIINEVIREKKAFEEKINSLIENIKFRNKIDKIEAGASLMLGEEDIKKVDSLTKQTSKKLYDSALRISNGDEEKAISLLFDDSDFEF